MEYMINYIKDQIQEVEMVESHGLNQIDYIEGKTYIFFIYG